MSNRDKALNLAIAELANCPNERAPNGRACTNRYHAMARALLELAEENEKRKRKELKNFAALTNVCAERDRLRGEVERLKKELQHSITGTREEYAALTEYKEKCAQLSCELAEAEDRYREMYRFYTDVSSGDISKIRGLLDRLHEIEAAIKVKDEALETALNACKLNLAMYTVKDEQALHVAHEACVDALSLTPIHAKAKAEAVERLVEAAKNVGMNWKIGAPYGLDALSDAIEALKKAGKP